jgi:hypothetical protein
MQKLSSEFTPITKYVAPAVMAAFLILMFALPDHEKPSDYLPLIIVGPLFLFLLWWTAFVKKVDLNGDHFVISNFLNQVSVPTAHLQKIAEHRGNRTRNITLFFEPATPFGRKIRIVTPFGITPRNHDEVASLLRNILNENHRGSTFLHTHRS